MRVIDLCSTQARLYERELVTDISSTLPLVAGDPMRVEQVLINLVHNALSYSRSGAVSLSVAQDGDQIAYSVSDNGPGIPLAQQAQIWQPYKRYGQGPGLGLGLYIVRRLTEAMSGDVQLESAPGAGSRFTIRLPLQNERPQRVQLP